MNREEVERQLKVSAEGEGESKTVWYKVDGDARGELKVTIGYHGNGIQVSVADDLEENERKVAMEYIAEWLTEATMKPDGDSHEWPLFSFGKVFMIGGRPFSVLRINIGSIVLQPLPTKGYGSPRKLIEMMT